jgi:hypothetical protein
MEEQFELDFIDEIEVSEKEKIKLTIDERILFRKAMVKIFPHEKCLQDCRQYTITFIEDCLSPNCPMIHETTDRLSVEVRPYMIVFYEDNGHYYARKQTVSVQFILYCLRVGLDLLIYLKTLEIHHLANDPFLNSLTEGIDKTDHREKYSTKKDSVGLQIRKDNIVIACLRQGLEKKFNEIIDPDLTKSKTKIFAPDDSLICFEEFFYLLITRNSSFREEYIKSCLEKNHKNISKRYSMVVSFEAIDTMRAHIQRDLLKYKDSDLNIPINDDQDLIKKAFEVQGKVLPYAEQLINGSIKFPKNENVVMLF